MKDARKIAEQLQDAEAKVLQYLGKKKSASVDQISYGTQLEKVAVGRAAMYLGNKQLVTQSKVTKKFVESDALGEQYSKSMLPEFKFLDLVSRKPLTIDELNILMQPDEVKFCLGYLKSKGLIEFSSGKVVATSLGIKTRDSLEHKLLVKLTKGPIELGNLTDEEKYAYQELSKRRSIIKTAERSDVSLLLTELGAKVAEQKLPQNMIGLLTSDVLKSGEWKNKKFRRYDVEAQVPKLFLGKKQAYLAFLDEVKRELVAMGFEEMTGPIVESTFFNADALFMPQDHPARGIHDGYVVKGKADLRKYVDFVGNVKKVHEKGGYGSRGWGGKFSEEVTEQLMLRSQGTALSARTLANYPKVPGKYFAIARCYRPDTVDATHLTEFNQLEGIILGKDLNFRQLLGLLSDFAKKIAGVDKIKFLPGYFPFTEPSLEGFIYHPKLKRWIEVLPAGIIRPEVSKPLGVDVPVLAWGIGIDRLFMVKENIDDIRQLFSSDLKWLREAKI